MSQKTQPLPPATDAAPRPAAAYEPPRILRKRSVEHVTLVSGYVGPGPGNPLGGH